MAVSPASQLLWLLSSRGHLLVAEWVLGVRCLEWGVGYGLSGVGLGVVWVGPESWGGGAGGDGERGAQQISGSDAELLRRSLIFLCGVGQPMCLWGPLPSSQGHCHDPPPTSWPP